MLLFEIPLEMKISLESCFNQIIKACVCPFTLVTMTGLSFDNEYDPGLFSDLMAI